MGWAHEWDWTWTSSDARASIDLQLGELWGGLIQALGELVQVARGHAREQVVLDVEEHVERDHALGRAARRAGDEVGAIAVVVDGPYCEERRQTLADQHRDHVVLQHRDVQHEERERDPDRYRSVLRPDPAHLPKVRQLDPLL